MNRKLRATILTISVFTLLATSGTAVAAPTPSVQTPVPQTVSVSAETQAVASKKSCKLRGPLATSMVTGENGTTDLNRVRVVGLEKAAGLHFTFYKNGGGTLERSYDKAKVSFSVRQSKYSVIRVAAICSNGARSSNYTIFTLGTAVKEDTKTTAWLEIALNKSSYPAYAKANINVFARAAAECLTDKAFKKVWAMANKRAMQSANLYGVSAGAASTFVKVLYDQALTDGCKQLKQQLTMVAKIGYKVIKDSKADGFILYSANFQAGHRDGLVLNPPLCRIGAKSIGFGNVGQLEITTTAGFGSRQDELNCLHRVTKLI